MLERRLPPGIKLALVALTALWPVCIVLGVIHANELKELGSVGEEFGQLTPFGLVLAVSLGPFAAFLAAAHRVGRRYGRCAITRDWFVFEPALLPAWLGRTVVSRAEIIDRLTTAHGVLVRAKGLAQGFFPLLIPTTNPAELDAALIEVDRREPTTLLSAGRRLDQRRASGVSAAFSLWLGLTVVATHAVLLARFDSSWASNGVIGCLLFALPIALCVAAATLPLVRVVHVGGDALAVGEELFTYDSVEVGVGEGFVVATEGGRSCVAHVGADEARVRDALLERLRARGREEALGPLPLGVTRWRRRARRALHLSPLVALPGVAIGSSLLAPNFQRADWEDAHGQRVIAVFARDAAAPVAVAIVDSGALGHVSLTVGWPWSQTLGPEDAAHRVDLTRGATFAHVRSGGTDAARVDWPSTLEAEWLRSLPTGSTHAPSPSVHARLHGPGVAAPCCLSASELERALRGSSTPRPR